MRHAYNNINHNEMNINDTDEQNILILIEYVLSNFLREGMCYML